MATTPDNFKLTGGENLTDPALSIPPGSLIASKNYELSVTGGYRRIDGHERYDGRTSPSAAIYNIQYFDNGTAAILSGDTVVGAFTSVAGVALVDAVIESGAYVTNDAAGYLVFGALSGPYQDNENLQVSAVTKSVANGTTSANDAPTDAMHDTSIQAAEEALRADIQTVPGEGDIDPWVYAGDKYAIRNATGGATAVMHKDSTAGWVAQALGNELLFDQGGVAQWPVVDGDVIEGVSSSASMTLTRVATRTGSFAGNDAEGVFVAATISGTFTDNEDLSSDHLDFDAGSIEIGVGDTVAGASSTETAIVTNVTVSTGAWITGDAAGYLTVKSSTGTFTDSENLQVGGTTYALVNGASEPTTDNIAVANGANAAITLPPSGSYIFHNANFKGAASAIRMYGVNGVGTGFEWDGTVFVPIRTGMDSDLPINVTEHKKHLFFAFANGSLQHSSIADQYAWSPITGAAEIGTSDEITGLLVLPKDVLAIFNLKRTYLLYGTSTADWNLTQFTKGAGSIAGTIQLLLNDALYLNERGITNLGTTQKYGDFQEDSLSKKIQPLIDDKKSLVISSVVSESKNQYRIFFSDNTGISLTIASGPRGKVFGFTRLDYGRQVKSICVGEDSSGNEEIFFGSTDGYVYQLDKGRSFDGTAIDAFFRTTYYHYGSPTRDKRFRTASLEMDTPAAIALKVVPDFSYGDPNISAAREQDLAVLGGGGYYNVDNYNEADYSAQIVSTSQVDIPGRGINMGLLFLSEATYERPHTIQGVTVHYSPGRVHRG